MEGACCGVVEPEVLLWWSGLFLDAGFSFMGVYDGEVIR